VRESKDDGEEESKFVTVDIELERRENGEDDQEEMKSSPLK
jgi:hypothetical protein